MEPVQIKPHEWTPDRDCQLCDSYLRTGGDFVRIVAILFPFMVTPEQCRSRLKIVKRVGSWTHIEQEALVDCVTQTIASNQELRWFIVARAIPGRSSKQCRERYYNHHAPGINKGPWSSEELSTLQERAVTLQCKWSAIARAMPGRTEAMVKNKWYSIVKNATDQTRGTSMRSHRRSRMDARPTCHPTLLHNEGQQALDHLMQGTDHNNPFDDDFHRIAAIVSQSMPSYSSDRPAKKKRKGTNMNT